MAAGLLGGFVTCAVAAAPTTPVAPTVASYTAIAKMPDFGGVWELVFGGPRGGAGAPEQPALTPDYAAKLKAYQAEGHDDNPTANCLPPGMPGIMNQPYPIEFLMTPGKITLVIEAYSQTRRIFLDGRKHDDPDPTFNGHSIGHWDGDTLVVDTVGFVTDTPLGGSWGIRHSDQMRIEERMRLTTPNTMEIRTTVFDPMALTKPFTATKTLARHRDWDIAEYVCEQNNRNSVNDEGKAHISLDH
ncbi:MAG TPA: hypothetical protein VGO53_05930 [Steroidobacteraceae bacterium]|nr:hypothetical protein [Steroidobacteraceae bacterium]